MTNVSSDTNILALPLATTEFVTGTNEDWIDSLVFLIDTDDITGPQLDLRGMDFELELRRLPPDHTVVAHASTKDGTLVIGSPPDFGYLTINMPVEIMSTLKPDDYVGDIVAIDNEFKRRTILFDLTLDWGITR